MLWKGINAGQRLEHGPGKRWKGPGKVLEKFLNFVRLKAWEPCQTTLSTVYMLCGFECDLEFIIIGLAKA